MHMLTSCIGFASIVSVAFIASFSAVSTNTNALFHPDQCPHHDLHDHIQNTSDSVVTWVRRYSVVDEAVSSAEMLIGDNSEALVLSAGHHNTSSAIGCKSLACSTDAAEVDGSTAMLLFPDILTEKICGYVSTVTYRSYVVYPASAACFDSENDTAVPAAPPLLLQGLRSLVMNASRLRQLRIYHLCLDSSQTTSLSLCLSICPTFSLCEAPTTLNVGLRYNALGSASPHYHTMLSINRSTCAVPQSLPCSYVAISVHLGIVPARGPTFLAIFALLALLFQYLLPIISPPFSFRRCLGPRSATTLRASGAYAAFAAFALMLPTGIAAQVSRLCRVVSK
jgi:hypothetical protein